MRQPDEVAEHLRSRFEHDYPDWARNRGTWPMRIPLRPPTTPQRSADPVACHAWADLWNAYTGPGKVEFANLRFPTGTHSMPKSLVLDHPLNVAAAHPDTRQTWERCGRRLTTLQRAFPHTRVPGIIRRITDLDEIDYQRLVNTVIWLRENPTSGMLLRQLPIEGIDTKWLTKHAHVVLALLGSDDAQSDDDTDNALATPKRLRLHERLGLRIPPDLLQVGVLDATLRDHLAGMRHLAASVEDLNQWPYHPDRILILENKETGYAITDDHPGAVVLHGHGLNVAHYARITWVRQAKKVIYWGDIDAPGLQFINDLRGYGITADTILMDIDTLNRFRHLSVDGARPQRDTLPHLTDSEQTLYATLVDYATANTTGLLLEQERIPWPYAHEIVSTALS